MSPIANSIPLSGAANASGGYLLPPEQGEILVNGILVETGAIQIAGDARSTSSRKTNFPVWLGRPTAGPVAEGASKPVTGASFGQASINVQKFASIIVFTDEQIEDVQNGDLNVLADAGVRQAISVSIDANAVGLAAGANASTVFDTTLLGQGDFNGIELGAAPTGTNPDTRLQKAVSAAMGVLEQNGYGNPAEMAVLLGFGFQRQLRDARDGLGRPLYDGGSYAGQSIDALYGLDRAHTTNLPSTNVADTTFTATAGTTSTASAVSGPIVVGAPIYTGGSAVAYVATYNSATGAMTAVKVSDGTAFTFAAQSYTVKIPLAIVAHKPNIHVRVRQDVNLSTSNEATLTVDGTPGDNLNLFQENLTAVRYECRLGFMVHDAARSIVTIWS